MRVGLELIDDLVKIMQEEERAGRVAVWGGINAAAQGLKEEWRRQIQSAGLGSRLARTIRSATYPQRRPSSSAAALIWTRAPLLIDVFENGATIRGKDGLFLAIPTEAAGTRIGTQRITPGLWEQRTGMRLRFIYRRNLPSLLVADDARINTRGRAAANRRRVRRDGIRTGSVTVPIFILVPQVTLRPRLDLASGSRRWHARVPELIKQNWPRT